MTLDDYKWGYCKCCHRLVAVEEISETTTTGATRTGTFLGAHTTHPWKEQCLGVGGRPTMPPMELTAEEELARWGP